MLFKSSFINLVLNHFYKDYVKELANFTKKNVAMELPENLNILIITLSDRASQGGYEDKSGPEIKAILERHFKKSKFGIEIEMVLIPDSEVQLMKALSDGKDSRNVIITTGGTGVGPNDITVDVVQPMLNKEIPGIMEQIRVKYGMKKPNALLSRGVAGVIGNSLIYTLPGSVKAVREYMPEILKTLEHLIYMLHDVDVHDKK